MATRGSVFIAVLFVGGLANFALLGEWRLFIGAAAGFLVAAPIAHALFRRRGARGAPTVPDRRE